MPFLDDCEQLYTMLKELPPTGSEGVEGLVRKLLEKWTGQRFFLSRSGDQAGADMVSLGQGNGIEIRCDTKRFGEKTPLKTRDLLGEIDQAARQQPSMDAWVLFSTREVPTQMAEELIASGKTKAVEVLILDTVIEHNHRVAAFCSKYSDVVVDHFKSSLTPQEQTSLRLQLTSINNSQMIQTAQRDIGDELTKAALGMQDAAQRTHQWLLKNFEHSGDAQAAFGQPLGILDADRLTPITRHGVFLDLNKWWSDGLKDFPVVVLLGEEGAGKTWAASMWLADKLTQGAINNTLPMTLLITYSRFEGDTPVAQMLIPSEVQRITEQHDLAYWRERLMKRWLKTPWNDARPQFLIVFDGLNERPNADWRGVLENIFGSDWKGRVAVLMTSRPKYWQQHVGSDGRYLEIKVPDYNDSELIQALSKSNILINDIPDGLKSLIRKPRYCSLVIKHYDQMVIGGHTSKEWLLYLDWKDRCDLKRSLPMTDEEFRDVVIGVAERVREGQSRFKYHELQELLPKSDPDGRVLEELREGSIFVPSDRIVGGFEVDHDRLVYALGMLLADDLQQHDKTFAGGVETARIHEADERLRQWLEPHEEMDLKGEIVGAAIFAALMFEGFTSAPLQALVRHWLAAQNLPQTIQETINGYARRLLRHYIDAAQYFWTKQAQNEAAHTRLLEAFIFLRQSSDVPAELIEVLNLWMGIWSVHGHSYERKDDNANIPELQAAMSERLGCELPSIGSYDHYGIMTYAIDDDICMKLTNFSQLIISLGDIEPFVDGIVTWAVARAINEQVPDGSEMNWLMRLNPGKWEEVVYARATAFAKTDDLVLQRAAFILFGKIGNQSSAEMQARLPEDLYPIDKVLQDTKNDPCTGHFSWRRPQCYDCLERDDVEPRQKIVNVAQYAYDPDIRYPDDVVQCSINTVNTFELSSMWVDRGQGNQELKLKTWEGPVLYRGNPRVLADFFRSVVISLTARHGISYESSALRFDELTLILTGREIQTLETTYKRFHGTIYMRESEADTKNSEQLLAQTILSHFGPEQQLELMLSRPKPNPLYHSFWDWFRALTSEQAREQIESILTVPFASGHLDHRNDVLWFLLAGPIFIDDVIRDKISSLLFDADATTRLLTLELVRMARDHILANTLVEKGVMFLDWVDHRPLAWAGSTVLAELATDTEFEDLAHLIDIGSLGYALQCRGFDDVETGKYVERLRLGWEIHAAKAVDKNMPSIPPYYWDAEPEGTGTSLFDEDIGRLLSPKSVGMTCGYVDQDTVFEEQGKRHREYTEILKQEEALDWTILHFQPEALKAVCRRDPDLAEHWVKALDTPDGSKLYNLMQPFYLALVPALLKVLPTLGAMAWMTIRAFAVMPRHRFKDLKIDVLDLAVFEAPDSAPVLDMRLEVLEQAWSDQDLLDVVISARRHGREGWLNEQIEEHISHDHLWRRARGLTLASFLAINDEKWIDLWVRAQVENTWVSDLREAINEYRVNEGFARHWFLQFLTHDDRDHAWAAYNLLKMCIDKRYWIWWEGMESEHEHPDAEEADFRLRFIRSVQGKLIKACDENAKDWDNVLFSNKISKGKISPFLN